MPPVSLWSVYVSLTAPEQTHTRLLVQHTHTHMVGHGMHLVHTVSTLDTLFTEKSRTESQAR